MSPSGKIYITIPSDKKIAVFDFRCKFLYDLDLSEMPEIGEWLPGKIDIDKDGYIYLVDHKNQRVIILDKNENYKSQFGGKGAAPGQFQAIADIEAVSRNEILVLDAILGLISAFDSTGRLLYKFGEKGSGTGKFSQPAGLVQDSSGNTWVVDSFRHTVLIYNSQHNFFF